MRLISRGMILGFIGSLLVPAIAEKPEEASLFNGKDLTGWKLRTPETDKRKSKWTVAGGIKLQEAMPRQAGKPDPPHSFRSL